MHRLIDQSRERFAEQLGDDGELFIQLLSDFVQSFGEHHASLERAIADGDSEQIRFHAHTIKGMCASMYFESLKTIANEIESSGRLGDVEPARRLLPALKQGFDVIRREIEELD